MHLVRDPRYVVRSAMRRRWYDGHSYDGLRIVPQPDSEAGRNWEMYDAFKRNLWLWAETNRWIVRFCSSVPADRVLSVHSEDIFSGEEETWRKLYFFIGAPMPSKRRIMGVLSEKLNAQETGTFPEPSRWSEVMYSEFRIIAGETAKALGYKI